MYERILVPLDGSKFAEQVFPPLVELARAFGSEVVLVEVCEPEETEFGQACRLYINNEAEKLEDNLKGSTAKVRTTVLEGKASEQILDYAEKSDVSLIMISSHGRSGLAPWSLGGTASKILHRVGVPLIIVRAKETPEESAKVRLFSRMQVLETGRHVHTIGGLDYIPYKDWDINQMKTRVQRYLDGASSKFSGTKASVKPEIRVGESAREIIKLAAKKDSSLIAMSSHGRAGIEAWAHDSITGKILQASRQSFMFVPVAGNA
jgi:nucleotide-binding universal stress UspA family protein